MFHSRLCQSFGTSVLWVLVIVLYQTCVNAQTFTDDWRTGCKALVGNVTDWQNAPGFVDQDGRAQPRFDPVTTWGITKERCDEVCSSKDLRYVRMLPKKKNLKAALTLDYSNSTLITSRLLFPTGCCHGWH